MKRSIWWSIILSQVLFICLLPLGYELLSYLHPIVIAVLWLCETCFVTFVIFFIQKQEISMPYRLFCSLVVFYTLTLLILLFFRPNEASFHNWNLIPFLTIKTYLFGDITFLIAFYNLAANIGLFVPYGFFIRTLSMKTVYTYCLSLLCICLIEIAQLVTHRGSLDIDDLILNGFGVYIGILLYPLFNRVVSLSNNANK